MKTEFFLSSLTEFNFKFSSFTQELEERSDETQKIFFGESRYENILERICINELPRWF